MGGKLTEGEWREVVGWRRWMERKTEDILRGGVGRGSDWREIVRRDCIGDCRENIFRRRNILKRRGDRSGKMIRNGNCLHDGTWQG